MNIFGHYRVLSVCGYLTGILCLSLAGFVIAANPKSKSCRIAFLFNVSVAVWSIFYATMYLVSDERLALLVSRILTMGSVALNAFFTHLVLIVVRKEAKRKNLLWVNYIAGAVLILLIFITRLIAAGAPPKMGYLSYTEAGPLYWLIPLYLFLNLIYSCFELIRGMKKLKGYRRSQLSLFLSAVLIGFGFGTPAFLLVFDIPIRPVTTPLVAFYPIILTYAIAKHRFLDIQKLAKNTVIFSLLFMTLLGVVSVVLLVLKEIFSRWAGLPDAAGQGVAIAMAIGFYGPLKQALSRITNRLLFQHAENPEKIFRQLSKDIFHYLDSTELASEATRRIAESLALDRIGFYLRSGKADQFFELRSSVGRIRKVKIHQSKQLVRYLEETKDFLLNPYTQRESRMLLRQKTPFRLDSIKEIKKEAVKELASFGGVSVFPVFIRDRLKAIVITGRKKSDAPWRDEEFQVLKSFSRLLSLALGNAEYAEEIRRSQERISLSERDASAGALITGVDHEVKNPLHALSLNVSALRAELTDPGLLAAPREKFVHHVSETFELVRRHIQDINGIISHLSDLAEKKPLTIEENVKPHEVAEEVIKTLTAEAEDKWHKVRISSTIPENLALACDRSALHEILLNLVRNARQAIGEEGAIRIEASVKGGETLICVRDTGTGIRAELHEKIFEPFFTTKRKGPAQSFQGSGMGLFIVKQFMEGMGGRVSVRSEAHEGATFRLHFPNLVPRLAEAA